MTERLQEILNRKPSKWGNLTVKEFERDIKLLQERLQELETTVDFYQSALRDADRRVQELEQKNDRLKQEADFWRVEDREMMRLSHENKRYREAIEKIKNKVSQQLEGLDAEEDMERVIKLSELMSISIEALECEG